MEKGDKVVAKTAIESQFNKNIARGTTGVVLAVRFIPKRGDVEPLCLIKFKRHGIPKSTIQRNLKVY